MRDLWDNLIGPDAPDASDMPPYEEPIDGSFPEHFDWSIMDICFVAWADSLTEAMCEELFALDWPAVDVVYAHFGDDMISPPSFMVHVDPKDFGLWHQLHGDILRGIVKHTGHMERFERPILRYMCDQGAYMIYDYGDFS